MFARAPVLLFAVALAACSPPMTSAPGMEGIVAEGLGPARHPLASGLYRFTAFSDIDDSEESYAEALAADEGETPEVPEYFVLQWHPASQSYALFMHRAQLFDLDGGHEVLAFSSSDKTVYLPLRLGAQAQEATVLVYGCTDLPASFLSAEGLGEDCEVETGAAVLEGLRRAELSAMAGLHFEFVSPLPDLTP